MFCNQCEQTINNEACTTQGVCGKNEDLQSLQDILVYGLKGIAAYAYHARQLGQRDEEVDAFMHEALFKTLTNVDFSLESHLGLALKAGEMNLRTMEMLDNANVDTYGKPEPTPVKTTIQEGPGILVTGHDLHDLFELLKQTRGTGIKVYTHGEMLPAHAYPKLKAFDHLQGHYGKAWQHQKKEFDDFAGPILVTTNCVLKPRETYRDRLYTTGITAVEGVKHLGDRQDYSAIIEHARTLGDLEPKEGQELMTGFHHDVLLGLADKIVDAVKAGKISRFFLIGGCDAGTTGRDYYRELAQKVPEDAVVLTLGCGKFRFNDLDMGDINGIPRLLDMGQCNNAFSAIQVAVALAEVFECSVNDLPLSLVLSWFEQKAVAILLTLFHLGVKNIRIGPSAPAFVSPNVLKVLQDGYNLMLTGDVDQDLQAMMAGS